MYHDGIYKNSLEYREIFLHTLPVDTGRKLNVHKTFRRRPGRLLNILCTFNLRVYGVLLLLFLSVSSLILRYLLINPTTSSAVVYLHLVSYFHNFRVPFMFCKLYSDACIGINSRTKVTKSRFITDLLLFILVFIYNNKNIGNVLVRMYNNKNIGNVLVRMLILKILNWE